MKMMVLTVPSFLDHSHLPSKYTVCIKQTRSMARKLSQEPELLQLYSDIIREQEQ